MSRLSQALSSYITKDVQSHQVRDTTFVESGSTSLRWGGQSSFNFAQPGQEDRGGLTVDTKEGETIKENRIIEVQARVQLTDYDLHHIFHMNSQGWPFPFSDYPGINYWIDEGHSIYAMPDKFRMEFTQILDKPRPGAERRRRRWLYNLVGGARGTGAFSESEDEEDFG